jgi:alkylation response protein AidB-like acyl-CoA dehydrogenase
VFQWTDEQVMVRDAVKQFIDKEIRPRVDEFEPRLAPHRHRQRRRLGAGL